MLALLATAARDSSARNEISLNTGWRFNFGESPGAESVEFDDAGWSRVDVPHTWNAFDGQDGDNKSGQGMSHGMKGDYARGSGWYRRTIRPSDDWAGRRVYLQFDGANRRSDVFVNGRLVGTHLGGFARFRFDLTDVLEPKTENLLAVRINNEVNGIAPHSGDFSFFGGIYRDVSLLITDAVQIETMDHASPGVYLKQASVTPEKAEVEAQVKIVNHGAEPADILVRVVVADAAGKPVQESQTPLALASGARGEVTVPIAIESPRLWNGRADPYLYTARIEVATAGTLRDSIEQPLGLRFFRADPQEGFVLNGKYLDLRGVSRHQCRLDKGWAISPEDEREDMALIAEMGCTAIRVAHYQQSPLWYRLADEQGMVLWAEIPFVNEAAPDELFFNNLLDQMRELIRQNYNHPSICFWGVGNETHDLGSNIIDGMIKNGPIQERQLQALHALVRAEDPTRLSTYASFHSEKDFNFPRPGQTPKKLVAEPQRWYTDVTAFNKYYGWYYGEPEHFADFFDSLHARNPDQCIGVSEYGAGGGITQHNATTYGGPDYKPVDMEAYRPFSMGKFHPEEYQAYFHEQTWQTLDARPYLWAKFIWNMFDFASDSRDEGDHTGRNDKGLVTFDRKVRKDAFFYYKSNWSIEFVLNITCRRFTERKESTTVVKVYCNVPEVELSVNGRSLGTQSVNGGIVVWNDVTLGEGDNEIVATAAFGEEKRTDTCTWRYVADVLCATDS
ncbi:MAG TPA: glycoside hydrolase family 2 TIM barrel-domain containing protein, partial [Opitutaceae bacterium]